MGCAFEGCEQPVKKKGLCNGHYLQRWRGEELREIRRNYFAGSLEKVIAWCMENAKRDGRCLILDDCYTMDGYPVKRFRGKQRKLGHLMLEWETGYSADEAAEEGMEMCHHRECTSRACISPFHLRWDTRGENIRDRHSVRRGELEWA